MKLGAGQQSLLMSSVAAGVLVAMTAAHAQDAAADQQNSTQTAAGATLLQRIVFGSGVEKVAIDTPQAVTVLDQEAIDDRQPSTIADIFRGVPGVTVIGSDRVAGQSFNIRGIGGLAAADESKIVVTVDGAVKFFEQYRVGSFFSEPELYKRVEVLRGPASSTLYGSGALGGVINFTTKDASDFLEPGKPWALRVKTGYDSNKEGLLGSIIGAYAFNDMTDVLISGNYRRANDYETGNGTRILGSEFNALSGLAKLTHRFGDNGEQAIRLSYQRWQSDADNTQYSQTGSLGFGTVDRDITDQTVVFSYENPASDNPYLDLVFNLSLSDTNVVQENASFPPIFSPIFADSEYGYRTWAGKLENTFESRGDSFENFLTIGTQLSYQERTAQTAAGALGFHPEGTDTKIGFYIQDEFIWNKLTIIPGARIDFVKLRPDSSITGASNTDEVAFSPKIAALYKITDSLSVFGSIAHTERVPTLDELFSTAGPNADYPGGRITSLDLNKEKSNNYEIGFSVSQFDLVRSGDSLQVKTTGYYNDLTNLISTNPNLGQATPVPYYVNIDRAKIYGVEVEAAYDAQYVFANVALNYIHGWDTTTGATLSTIPGKTLDVTLGGRLPDHNVSFGWNALFASGMRTGATTGPFGGYGVHDVFLDWKPDEGQFRNTELRASVENIFDKQYQNNLAGDPAKGRTFKLSLAHKF
jgi:hemoglobin/transferrin/lactoferrin receptor protein